MQQKPEISSVLMDHLACMESYNHVISQTAPLLCSALLYSTLFCSALLYSHSALLSLCSTLTLLYSTLCYSTLLRSTLTLLYCTLVCATLLYSTVLYATVR